MLRVASYNIRKCIGTDRRRVPERVLAVIGELDADVVALQEADKRLRDRPSALPADLLAAHGYRAVDLGGGARSIGWHGNAILVRSDARVENCRPLDLPTLEPRGAVMADVDFGQGRRLRVVGMHLDLSGLWRRRQVRALLAHVAACEESLPTVLMGDMNEWTRHGGCLREIGSDYHFARTGRSFHSRRPVAELDRIIVSCDVAIDNGGVHRSALSGRASDHLPIWADIAARGWTSQAEAATA